MATNKDTGKSGPSPLMIVMGGVVVIIIALVVIISFQKADKEKAAKAFADRQAKHEQAEQAQLINNNDSFLVRQEKAKVLQKQLLNEFFTAESKGVSTINFFCSPSSSKSFFALRSWTVVNESAGETISNYTVRVESSNKGGQPITILWNVWISQSNTDPNKFCISSIREN